MSLYENIRAAVTSVEEEADTEFLWELRTHFGQNALVILYGVGKSYRVAELGADLLRSVGVNSLALHAVDVLHGGANVYANHRGSVVGIGISHSGETEETVKAQKKVALDGFTSIALTSKGISSLVDYSNLTLLYTAQDGSKHGTIPTASVAAQLAWLNTIVCAIADSRSAGFLGQGHTGGQLAKTYKEMQ